MNNIKRYDASVILNHSAIECSGDIIFDEDKNGEYVRYDDIAHLLKDIKPQYEIGIKDGKYALILNDTYFYIPFYTWQVKLTTIYICKIYDKYGIGLDEPSVDMKDLSEILTQYYAYSEEILNWIKHIK